MVSEMEKNDNPNTQFCSVAARGAAIGNGKEVMRLEAEGKNIKCQSSNECQMSNDKAQMNEK